MDIPSNINGDLNLRDRLDLTELPSNLNISGSLILKGCINLRTLPKGLTVGRNLYALNCRSLKQLPDDLNVGGLLDLNGCPRITTIPETVHVGCVTTKWGAYATALFANEARKTLFEHPRTKTPKRYRQCKTLKTASPSSGVQ